MMVEITPELEKIIAEECGKFRFDDDDCMTDEEFEDWAGCKRATREEIKRKNKKK